MWLYPRQPASAARHAAAALAGGLLCAAVVGVLRHRRSKIGTAARAQLAARHRKRRFLRSARGAYGYAASAVGHIDNWRRREHPSLIAPIGCSSMASAVVYLDYGGSALPARSQLAAMAEAASSSPRGNPHSVGPMASAASVEVEGARQLVLRRFCGERHADWEVVWTSGATAALRLLSEAFPWSAHSQLLFPASCHTSVVGMRGPAAANGASSHCFGSIDELLRLIRSPEPASPAAVAAVATWSRGVDSRGAPRRLLVLPAECNLSGERLSLSKVARELRNRAAAEPGGGEHAFGGWWLAIDAAKAAACGSLDVSRTGAAFCVVSFYKLFGAPTGLGALLVRRDALRLLRKPAYFGGGSVAAVLPASVDFNPPKGGTAGLEDGTLHFHGIASLRCGFDAMDAVGGASAIRAHTNSLATELVARLRELRHADGVAAVTLYGPWAKPTKHGPEASGRGEDQTNGRLAADAAAEATPAGPTVAFNILRADGSHVGYAEVARLAALNRPPIQLRTGCCCNPGGCHALLGLDAQTVRAAHGNGKQCGDERDLLDDGRPTGVVRASLGKDSIWEDVDALIEFLRRTFVMERLQTDLGSSVGEVGLSPLQPPPFAEAEVAAVYLYPVKSCAPMKISGRWPLHVKTGRLAFDREWAILGAGGEVLRTLHCPKMATIQAAVDLQRRTITLTAPSHKPLLLDLDTGSVHADSSAAACASAPTGTTSAAVATTATAVISQDDAAVCVASDRASAVAEGAKDLTLCGQDCRGRPFGGAVASQWLSHVLGFACKLVRFHPNAVRDEGSAFVNEAPLLALSLEAVEALNAALADAGEATVDARYFRPNVVLKGRPPGALRHAGAATLPVASAANQAGRRTIGRADTGCGGSRRIRCPEDDWASLVVGGEVHLRVVGPCQRCTMVEFDPASGAKHGSVLRALAQHRRDRGRIVFGVFCTLDSKALEVAGDVVSLSAGQSVEVRMKSAES